MNCYSVLWYINEMNNLKIMTTDRRIFFSTQFNVLRVFIERKLVIVKIRFTKL